ncbi:MAG: hypothetical protein PHH47_10710 [Gallionella sp.]|nr:hypothetical protein [Gallionella sp.]MDD4947027.1 hypothetical protein [Gallionella sp.]MDD5612610.1 hypothetical protein [Gallionella sp.]
MANKPFEVISGVILLALMMNNASGNAIGTVFFSPAERAALVAARQGITQTAIYSVNGIIRRAGGKSVVWVNGRAVNESPQDEIIPTLKISRDHVEIEDKPIKVGESLDVISGQRILRLPEKAVQVKP